MKRWGLRASSLSAIAKADAGQNTSINHLTPNVLYMMLCVRCSFLVLIVCRLCVGKDTLFAKFWLVSRLVRLGNVCGCSEGS